MIKDDNSIVYLVGMMGSGKSYLGACLADALGYNFIDMDSVIVTGAGESITDIFKTKGEPYFRQLESDILRTLAIKSNVVIATGGGAPIHHNGMQIMKSTGKVIWIKVSLETIYNRISTDSTRPLANQVSKSILRNMLRERTITYAQADLRVWNRGVKDAVIERIIKKLK